MDVTPRTEALRIAKGLIASHGMAAHMNKYNRDLLSREVTAETTGLRYEYHLDATKSTWADANPSCTVSIVYNLDPAGSRLMPDGSMVVDSFLRLGVSASGSDMNMDTFRQRESMITMLGMLCEMLQASLPQKLTLTMETAAQVADRTQRTMEQMVGIEIFDNIGAQALKGLRKNGSGRTFRLTEAYKSNSGKYPASGTYRFRQVRLTDRRGRPKDVAFYTMRVLGNDGTVPPVVVVRRVDEFA